MATERLDIIVRIRNAAAQALKDLKTGFGGIGSAALGATGILRGFVGQLGAIAGVVGGGAFIKSAISTFADFDDVMRQAGAVTGATADEMKAMTAVARQMGATTRFTSSQAADGLRLMGMAGFEAQEAIDALPGVLDLAAAGSLDLGTAADIATNVLAGFGLEVENLGQVNDALVKTFTSSNTTLTELGEAFKLVGPIAKGVGADFEELLAAIGKLGDAGLKGTLAGTALRGALNALFNPTKEEAALLQELAQRAGQTSFQVKDAEGNFVGFARVIEQLRAAGLKGEEALQLFGQRAGPGMAALLQVGEEELRKLTNEVRNFGGGARQIARDMEAGIGGAIRETVSAFEALKISLVSTFGPDIIAGIRNARDVLRGWVTSIENLDPKVIESYAEVFKSVFGFITSAVKTAYHEVDSFTKLAIAGIAAVSGNLDIAKAAIDDFIKSNDDFLASKGLIASADEREKKAIDENIIALEKQIAITKRKIETNKEDLESWRAKVLGTETYQRELEKNQEKLSGLEKQLSELTRKKTYVEAKIEVNDIDALAKVGKWSREAGKTIEESASTSGPIGRGTQKVQEATAKVIDPEAGKKNITSAMAILRAQIGTEAAVIQSEYDQGLVKLDKYFEEREALIRSRVSGEIALLREAAAAEKDDKKKEAFNAQILLREQELQTAIIELENERFEKQKDIDQKRVEDEAKLKQLQLKAEKAHQDQLQRVKLEGGSPGLEATFQKETADLQQRQNEELNAVNEFYNTKLEMLRAQADKELEIEQTLADQKKAIQDQQNLQGEEQQKLVEDQNRRRVQMQLDNYANIAGGAASALEAAYELTGKKNKELFIASKAFAIAQAIMKTYESATSAYASLAGIPYVGPALGAAAAAAAVAAGLANVAQIKGQSLAEGGEVLGKSPSTKADNIPINATAGEFMQPVSSVRYYGKGIMEAIRSRSIPREALSSFSVPNIRYGNSHFAQGGAVTPNSGSPIGAGGLSEDKLSINNFIDPSLFSQHMQSTTGRRDVWNVLTENPQKLRQIAFAQQ